jgi:hypothetical protein
VLPTNVRPGWKLGQTLHLITKITDAKGFITLTRGPNVIELFLSVIYELL